VKVRDVIKLIEADGWFFIGQEGSHRQYKHPVKKGRVTISGHSGEDMPKGTMNNVLKQAGLKG
jgi:predicted RNA binding protein YcfA (HicA-like mRNA interferase family)